MSLIKTCEPTGKSYSIIILLLWEIVFIMKVRFIMYILHTYCSSLCFFNVNVPVYEF